MGGVNHMRELTDFEIDSVSGGNWFQDLASAIAHFAGQVFEMTMDAVDWFFDNFDVTYSDDGITVSNK